MNYEKNIPTMYNAFILLLSASLLTIIAMNEKIKRDKWLWTGMAIIFLYIGIDEFTGIHEVLYFPFLIEQTGTGFLKYRWVVPYSIVIVAIVILYAPHIFRLPMKIRNKIILAGAVFVTGGLGLEMVGGYFETHGFETLFMVAITLEESGEMIGILIFIHALIDYIKYKFESLTVQVKLA